MQFNIIFSLGFFCYTVASSPILPRSNGAPPDYKTMVDVLNYLNYGVQRTTQDLGYWAGDYQGADLLVQDFQYLFSSVVEGTAVIAATKAVSTWDSTSFLNPAYQLNNNLDALINGIIGKKNLFDAAGRTQQMYYNLAQLHDAAGGLARAIESKLPWAAWIIAQPVVSTITSKVDKAVTAFNTPANITPLWSPNQPPNAYPPQGQPQNQPSWQQNQAGQWVPAIQGPKAQ